jgi:hypothetical protein
VRIRPSVLFSRRNLIVLTGLAFLLGDLAVIYVALHGDFGYDFSCCYQQAGQHLLNDRATLYDWSATYTFRYSPWGAFLFTPLAPLTATQALWTWFGVKLLVLAGVAAWFSAPWTGGTRLLVAGAILIFPPLWHDLVLGNVSIFTVVVLLALLRRPTPTSGGLFGLLVLIAPKPYLIPVALWLAIRRPLSAAAGLAVLFVGSLVGVLAFGSETWAAYVRTFIEPLTHTFTANIGFSGHLGPVGVVLGAICALVIVAFAVRRPGATGLGLAITSGVVLGPYTFIHYLSGLIVAAEPYLRKRPRLLAIFPWLLLFIQFTPIWLLAFAGVQVTGPQDLENTEASTA